MVKEFTTHDLDKKAWENFKKSNSLSKIGKIILKTGAANWYRNGTFFQPSFKWYHPITWIYILVYIILVVPACMLSEATLKEVFNQLWEDLTVDKFFKKNPEKLRWVDKDWDK